MPSSHRRASADHSPDGDALFWGNLTLGRHYTEQHLGQNRLDKSGFTRRLPALNDTPPALLRPERSCSKDLHTEARCVVDSFPVAVCQNIRFPAVRS